MSRADARSATVRVEDAVYARLRELGVERNCSLNDVVRGLLEERAARPGPAADPYEPGFATPVRTQKCQCGHAVCDLHGLSTGQFYQGCGWGRDEAAAIAAALNSHAALVTALRDARDHLEWCGWGDSWERECAREAGLPERVDAALAAVGVEASP